MKIFHFNIPSPAGNFGDDILYYSTQRQFEHIFHGREVEWVTYPLRNHTTEKVIEKANSCDLVLVGGGGLLLEDTAKNKYSGWQWACSLDHLRLINKPLVVYAIGYNRFRGQGDFEDFFKTHLKATVEKASFFSVRNNGSKEALQEYGVSDGVHVNPCPSLFYPQVFGSSDGIVNIGINLAGDRTFLRFDEETFYKGLLEVCESLIEHGIKLHFFNHNWNPESNCQRFIDQVPEKEVHDVETVWGVKDIESTLRQYNSMDLILAMRTHAQIVPFGQRKKVLSLISHDKLKWFLDDMDMGYTGLEVTDSHFPLKLYELIVFLLNDKNYYERQDKALQRQRDLMDKNSAIIRGIL